MPRTYRFDPPDRSGWLLGLSAPQIVLIGGTTVLAAYGASQGLPLPVAVTLVAVSAVMSLLRMGGQPLIPQLPAVARFWRLKARGATTWTASLALLGAPRDGQDARVSTPALPRSLEGLAIIAAEPSLYGPGARLGPVAVVHDRASDLYSATLSASGQEFALIPGADQEALLDRWGDALAAFCKQRGHAVVGVRWGEWTAPAGMNEQLAYVAEQGHSDPVPAAATAYGDQLGRTGPVATRHEVLVTVVVSRSGVRLAARHGGNVEAACCEAVLNELQLFAGRLEAIGAVVSPPLNPGELARALRVRLDPTISAVLDRRGRTLGDLAGQVPPANAGPLATELSWGHWQADDSYHRVFYVQEWPRSEVGPGFMGDLLLDGGAVRTVAVLYEPRSPRASHAAIREQAAKLDADTNSRAKRGFRVGRQQLRDREAVEQREDELVAGHAELYYVGLIGVSAPTLEALDEACQNVTQTAAGCGMELRALDGQHDVAMSGCLPIPRGLAPTWSR